MSAWTSIPGTPLATLVAELRKGMRERTSVSLSHGYTPWPEVLSAGDVLWRDPDYDKHWEHWEAMQDTIESLVSWTNLGYPTNGYANPQTKAPWGVTQSDAIAAFFDSAGFAGTGANRWRRLVEWDGSWPLASPATYSFGKTAYGDIVGPWIVEDMQKALSALSVYLYQTPPDESLCDKNELWRKFAFYPDAWPADWSLLQANNMAHLDWNVHSSRDYFLPDERERVKNVIRIKSAVTNGGITLPVLNAWITAANAKYPSYSTYHDYAGTGADGAAVVKEMLVGSDDVFYSDDAGDPDRPASVDLWTQYIGDFRSVVSTIIKYDFSNA